MLYLVPCLAGSVLACVDETRFSLLFEALNGRMGRLSFSENASLGGGGV